MQGVPEMTHTKDEALKLALDTTPPAAPDLQAELEATNRQVEILSDALAESRREIAALKAVQPVAWIADTKRGYNTVGYECKKVNALPHGTMLYTTPPAAKRKWVGLTVLEQADCFANTEDATEFYHAIEAKLKERNQ
jgi:hypothetical protein